LTIDEVDAITGPAIGRPPRSATFRLGDIVGVDLMAQMGKKNPYRSLEKTNPQLGRVPLGPISSKKWFKRGWWGEKKGKGRDKAFTSRVKTDKGGAKIPHVGLTRTMEYRSTGK